MVHSTCLQGTFVSKRQMDALRSVGIPRGEVREDHAGRMRFVLVVLMVNEGSRMCYSNDRKELSNMRYCGDIKDAMRLEC